MPKVNVDHTIGGQGTAISTLDHSATTPRTTLEEKYSTGVRGKNCSRMMRNMVVRVLKGNDMQYRG